METEDTARMLLLFAPADVLEELELNQENALEWATEIRGWHEYHQVELAALALYYSARLPTCGAKYQGTVSVGLSTIYALVQLAKVNESDTVRELMDAVLLEKRQGTMKRNRGKKVKPDWHEDAIAYDAQGLSASVIAKRLQYSPSQVRRVLNNSKK